VSGIDKFSLFQPESADERLDLRSADFALKTRQITSSVAKKNKIFVKIR